jgi:hypothetical protein
MIDRPNATRNSDDAEASPFRNWTMRKDKRARDQVGSPSSFDKLRMRA